MSLSEVGASNLISDWPWVGAENYRSALDASEFFGAARVTAEIAAFLLFVDIVLGFIVASMLVETNRANRWLQAEMMFVWALPPIVIGTAWKFLLQTEGLLNNVFGVVGVGPIVWLADPSWSRWSVALVSAWASFPFAVTMYRSALISVPLELLEAAAIDGAGWWTRQIRVVLPQVRSVVMVLSILVIVYSFRAFDFVFVLTAGGPGRASTNLPYLAYREAFTNFDLGYGAAIAVVSMGFIALLGVAYVRVLKTEID